MYVKKHFSKIYVRNECSIIYVDVCIFFYLFSSTNKTVTMVQTVSVFKDYLTPKDLRLVFVSMYIP